MRVRKLLPKVYSKQMQCKRGGEEVVGGGCVGRGSMKSPTCCLLHMFMIHKMPVFLFLFYYYMQV